MKVSSRTLAIAASLLLPLLIAVLSSARVRSWLRGTGSLRQTASNTGVGVLFLLTQIALRGTLIAAYAAVSTLVPWKLPDHPASYVLAFVLLDAVYYLQHRLEHAVPLLWAIHSVHHQSIDYNWSVSFRVGVLASVSTVAFHTLVALCGVDTTTYAAVGTVHAALLFMLHARTKFTVGPGRFFNAPVFHRVHHATNAFAIDKNFGGVFLVFDRVFGTFAPFREGLDYGVHEEAAPANPLAANVAPWVHLLSTVSKKKTLGAKIRACFTRDV
jgi:alkylglycerol monooxygenase